MARGGEPAGSGTDARGWCPAGGGAGAGRGRRAGADGGGGRWAEVGGWLGGGLVGKGRGRGEIHRAPSILKCERCCSLLDCRLSEWGQDLALRPELGRLRGMTKCQVSAGPPGEAGRAGSRAPPGCGARKVCQRVSFVLRGGGAGSRQPVRPRAPPAAPRGGGPRQAGREDPAAHGDRR